MKWASLKQRQRENEWMDAPDVDPATLEHALGFIRKVNRLLGYTRATLWHLDRLTRGWDHDRPITILDVATGSADIPLAVLHWADVHQRKVSIVGIDLHEKTIETAQSLSQDPRLQLLRADAFALPFPDGQFDIAITNMFLHHLEPPGVKTVLAEMNRVASRGMIVGDLVRSRRAYAWIKVLTLFSGPMIRHDAAVSVAGAFSRGELLELAHQAKLGFLTSYRHFGHRQVLAGLK